MTLQERDYTLFLNDEEREAFELEEKIENRKGVKNHREFPRFSHPDELVREFIWHRRSLFPNNYLHLLEYKKLNFDDEAEQYHDVIYKAKNEQEIQKYIKQLSLKQEQQKKSLQSLKNDQNTMKNIKRFMTE